MECIYTLGQFGIPRRILPVDIVGSLQTNDFLEYVQHRRSVEKNLHQRQVKEESSARREATTNLPLMKGAAKHQENHQEEDNANHAETTNWRAMIVKTPTDLDVLIGRGTKNSDHCGNLKLTKLVEQNFDEYEAAPKFQKTVISISLVQMVKRLNGRFLKYDKQRKVWIIQSDEIARDKVAHGFRNAKSKMKLLQGQKISRPPVPPSVEPTTSMGYGELDDNNRQAKRHKVV